MGVESRSTSVEIIELRRFRHFDSLSQNLALLVRRQKRDIRRIPPASDPDDAFDWGEPGRIDQPPAIFEIDLKDGVEIGRVELKRIGADGAGRNAQSSHKCDAQMRKITAYPRAVYKCPLRGRFGVADTDT